MKLNQLRKANFCSHYAKLFKCVEIRRKPIRTIEDGTSKPTWRYQKNQVPLSMVLNNSLQKLRNFYQK